jgi:septum formation protein
VVLGADTTVFLDGCAINKPRDLVEARAMLRRLSGREHTVFTGVAVRRVSTGLRIDEGVSSQVVFKAFGDEVIERYVGLVNTLDKAGAYSVQDHTELIVAEYRGSFTNIMGLPMEATKQILTNGVLQG